MGDDNFKCIFVNGVSFCDWNLTEIVPKGLIDNESPLVHVMACCRQMINIRVSICHH